jgi:hypothetical protein
LNSLIFFFNKYFPWLKLGFIWHSVGTKSKQLNYDKLSKQQK